MRTYFLLSFVLLVGCYSTQDLTGQLSSSPEEEEGNTEPGDDDDDDATGNDDDATSDDDDATSDDDDATSDDDDATSDDDDEPEPEVDAADIEFHSFPGTLNCGETATATVTVRNTGLADWTQSGGYKLGAVDDSDPFYGPGTRVWLGESSLVPPQATWTFAVELTAPSTPGTFITDWRMVHEGVTWFGETVSASIDVECSEQTFEDPLTDAGVASGFASKAVSGGSFGPSGWQSNGGADQLMIELDQPIWGDGTVEIDVTNFDPPSQYSGPKYQIVNLYTSDNGSQDVFSSNEAWWNLRTGSNYGTGIKFLASPLGGGNREEVRLLDGTSWDPADLHTWTVTWDASSISILLDGVVLDTLSFGGRIEPLQVLFIGTDNVYSAQGGPIYSNLRVTYSL
jgi:hypothetical protein